MGVDWYPCVKCGETFPDCGPHVSCDCGNYWCSDECAEKDGFRRSDDDYSDGSCKFCRHEDLDDATLVNFMLKHFRKTREEMVTIFNGTTFSEEG